ncbi:MAG TPA: prepilin-type N-terminal cleavage/methylation domain-containing protein [Tepidisphaeraceae bacterium]
MRQARRGFTLIELLVVIGIIMVLVGLLVYGFRAMNRSIGGRETHAELKVATAMLTAYEGRNQLQGIEFISYTTPPQTPDPGAPFGGLGRTVGFPVFVDPAASMNGTNLNMSSTNPPGLPGTYWPALALADIETGSGSSVATDMSDKTSTSPRYANAVKQTADVMYVLMRIPANQTTLQSIQPKRLLEQWPSSPAPNTLQQGNVLLDGWGNPIIFVPRGGLHVNIKDPATGTLNPYVVRSTGTLPVTGAQDPPLNGSERPFFASAGQDGDFTAGEDNVYSFQE